MILHGTYTNNDISELSSMFLTHLACKTSVDVLPSQLTEAEVMKKFSLWPEKTTTSLSGQHLGHYHSLLPWELPQDPNVERMEAT
jgi:hypothetical protein